MTENERLKQARQYVGTSVALPEMLNARERRVLIQKRMTGVFRTPIISFTLNIPGPVKVLPLIPEAFFEGTGKIVRSLEDAGFSIEHSEILIEKTGLEAFFAVCGLPEAIKKIMVSLEDANRIGRLYDIDIIRTDGTKVSRKELGLPVRKCLLCGQPAFVCSRSRNHSVEELTKEIGRILAEHTF